MLLQSPSASRRQFLRATVLAAASVPFLGCGDSNTTASTDTATENDPAMTDTALPYLDTLGIQLWTVREPLAEDPETTLRTLKELGYYQVEAMDTRQLADLKPICDDLGLRIHSSFMLWETLTQTWELTPDETKMEFAEVLDQANNGGVDHLVFGYFQPGARETADDWKRVADQINAGALRAKEAGLQMAYHNHNFEWDPVEETTGWAILQDRLDGNLCPFELDLFWAQIAGQDPRQVMGEISNRVSLLHLKQLHTGTPVVTTLAEVPPNAFEELPNGEMPIKDLMRYGKELGVEYCMVEQDGNWKPDPLGSAKTSIEFLRQS